MSLWECFLILNLGLGESARSCSAQLNTVHTNSQRWQVLESPIRPVCKCNTWAVLWVVRKVWVWYVRRLRSVCFDPRLEDKRLTYSDVWISQLSTASKTKTQQRCRGSHAILWRQQTEQHRDGTPIRRGRGSVACGREQGRTCYTWQQPDTAVSRWHTSGAGQGHF